MDPTEHSDRDLESATCPGVRWGLLAFGWINVALGVVGMVLPVMPTTVFLLVALWAFAKSSPRFHRWLYNHPRLGHTIRAWHEHGVIPLRAKVLALAVMGASLLYVSLVAATDWTLPTLLALPLAGVAVFIVTRPSRVPSRRTSAG